MENGVRAGRTIPLGGKTMARLRQIEWRAGVRLRGEQVKSRKMTPLDRSFSLADSKGFGRGQLYHLA